MLVGSSIHARSKHVVSIRGQVCTVACMFNMVGYNKKYSESHLGVLLKSRLRFRNLNYEAYGTIITLDILFIWCI
jgi:hypothetical protein